MSFRIPLLSVLLLAVKLVSAESDLSFPITSGSLDAYVASCVSFPGSGPSGAGGSFALFGPGFSMSGTTEPFCSGLWNFQFFLTIGSRLVPEWGALQLPEAVFTLGNVPIVGQVLDMDFVSAVVIPPPVNSEFSIPFKADADFLADDGSINAEMVGGGIATFEVEPFDLPGFTNRDELVDDVHLDFTPIPEPRTSVLSILAILGMHSLYKRSRAG